MKPIPTSAGKPLLPWVSLGAAAIFVMLLLGASDQHLIHFQKPYYFEAASEPTIEIIDAPIVLNVDSKPSVRNQIGRAVTPGKNSGTALQIDDTGLTSNTQIVSEKGKMRVFLLSAGEGVLTPVQGAPAFEQNLSFTEGEPLPDFKDFKRDSREKEGKLSGVFVVTEEQDPEGYSGIGGFAVSEQTFYVEWNRRLFRWKSGDSA